MSRRLHVTISRASQLSLRDQLRGAIQEKIKAGMLRPGQRLPSSRQLANDLRLARSVVVEVYQQLEAEGYLTSVPRSGTRVADLAMNGLVTDLMPLAGEAKAELSDSVPVRWDLRVGLADTRNFPRREWLASLRQAVQHAAPAHLEYPPVCGIDDLRVALASYLGRVRAVRALPANIMVTAGFAQGLSLICQMLGGQGHTALAIEDPGHPSERRFVEGLGFRSVPIPVDDEGMDIDALAASGVRAVLLTPAHQFPTGVVLSAERRAALVAWARRVGGLIIEDDYDGEFWFDGPDRFPALQSMAPDCVIYGSSVSKTLVPGLRLGWLAIPGGLTAAMEVTRMYRDLGISAICQLAYALFIESGRLDRHLLAMNKRYSQHRTALVSTLHAALPGAQVIGRAAGVHCTARLPVGMDEQQVTASAARHGVVVRGASSCSYAAPPPDASLIIGYANYHPDSLVSAMCTLASAAHATVSDRRAHAGRLAVRWIFPACLRSAGKQPPDPQPVHQRQAGHLLQRARDATTNSRPAQPFHGR